MPENKYPQRDAWKSRPKTNIAVPAGKPSQPGPKINDPELQVDLAKAANMPLKFTYLDGSFDIVVVKERGMYSYLVQLAVRIDLPADQVGAPFLVYKHALRSIRPI